jgi:hypothetical protein
MLSLGRLFARQDHADQAEQWYRKAAAAGISNTISELTERLAEHEPGDQGSDRTANQPTSPNDVP